MLSKTTKNRFGYKLDKLFWFLVVSAPLIGWLFSCFHDSSISNFSSFMQQYFSVIVDGQNPIASVFYRLFGDVSTIFPLVGADQGILRFLIYASTMEVLHVCFDVIVFIPRLAHKWISKAVQDD